MTEIGESVGGTWNGDGTDRLTGLPARDRFIADLSAHMAEHSEMAVLCLLDIDKFRFLNAVAGAQVADFVLQRIATILRKNLAPSDMLGRIGDDEFAVLMTEMSLAEASCKTKAMIDAVSDYQLEWLGRIFKFSASAGLASILDCDSVEFSLNAATSACGIAKGQGRGSIVVADPSKLPWDEYHRDARILLGLQSAISDNRLRLYAQEIFDLSSASGRAVEFELLVHMVDTNGTEFPPSALIPAAERHGFIRELDRWVLKAALVDNAELLMRNPDVTLSLNLSGQSLGDDGLWPFVTALFEQSGLDANRIQFEITETSAISDMSVALRFVQSARALGCKVALDDFGSGLSSFAYLRSFPVDCIKIDGAFVGNVADETSTDRAIVNAIVGVARALDLIVVAEHVDSAEILRTLSELGIDKIQGFLMSRPIPFIEVLQKKAF